MAPWGKKSDRPGYPIFIGRAPWALVTGTEPLNYSHSKNPSAGWDRRKAVSLRSAELSTVSGTVTTRTISRASQGIKRNPAIPHGIGTKKPPVRIAGPAEAFVGSATSGRDAGNVGCPAAEVNGHRRIFRIADIPGVIVRLPAIVPVWPDPDTAFPTAPNRYSDAPRRHSGTAGITADLPGWPRGGLGWSVRRWRRRFRTSGFRDNISSENLGNPG